MPTLDSHQDAHRATATRLAWSSTGLRVPSDLATGVVARESLSISSASAINSCPARWAAEKLFPTPDAALAPTVIGNAGHDVLEDLFNLPGPDRTIDTAARLLDDMTETIVNGDHETYTLPELADRSTRLQWTSAVWAGINTLWTIEDPTTVDVYATECQVKDVTVGGVPFGGYIDRIDRVTDKNGSPALALRDFKTGKYVDQAAKKRFGDNHGDQLRLYAEAVETIMTRLPEDDPDQGLKVIEAHDYYTKHGKATKVALSAPYRRQTVAAHASTWAKHNQMTSTGDFPAEPSGLCTYCPLVRQCPSRAAKINWPKVKPTALTLAEAPILPPVGEYAPQALVFGDDWDEKLTPVDYDDFEWIDWEDCDLEQTAPVTAGLSLPEDMNPLTGLDDGRYTALRDPFSTPMLPTEAAPAQAYGAVEQAVQDWSQTIHRTSEDTMNDQQPGAFFEDAPYRDDPMNIAAYRHLSANHLVNKALAQIRLAGIDGTDLTQPLIHSTASILWNVVTTVQEQIIGHRNLQSSVARNLLYSLEEVLQLEPMPLVKTAPNGQRRFATSDEITAWGVTAISRLGALASIGVDLAHNGGNLGAASAFRGNPIGVRGSATAAQGQVPTYSGAPQFQPIDSDSTLAVSEDTEATTFEPSFNY